MAGIGGNGGHLATRRWFYLIPAPGAPSGLGARHRTAQPRPPARATKAPYAGRVELEAGAEDLLVGLQPRGDGILAGNAPSPTCRASMPAPSRLVRDAGVEVATSGRSGPALRSGCGTPPRSRSHREAAEKLYRIKDRAFEAIAERLRDGTRDHRVRHPAADGATGSTDEGLVAGSRAERLGAGERRQSALPADAPIGIAGDPPRRRRAARPVGQAAVARRGLSPTSRWVGFTGRRRAGAGRRARSPPSPRPGTRR